MTTKDSTLLSEAYLSIKKKAPTTSLEAAPEPVSTAPNETVSVGPMEEPAPGVSMDMAAPAPSTDTVVTTTVSPEMPMSPSGDCGSNEQEEAHEMALDNLNSIRDSIMKIAAHCGSGEHLPAWSLQKLAIAMDNLADVARALR